MSATKPAAEVIQEWADFDSAGYTFERGRMEKNVQAICLGDKPASLPSHIAAGPSQGQKLKRDDVDFLTLELSLPRHVAESSLAKHNGNLQNALNDLVQAPQSI